MLWVGVIVYVCKDGRKHIHMLVQLTPALTDFKGPTILIGYKHISVIASTKNIKKQVRLNKDASEVRD